MKRDTLTLERDTPLQRIEIKGEKSACNNEWRSREDSNPQPPD